MLTEYLPPHQNPSHIKQWHIINGISALTEDYCGYDCHIDDDAKKDQQGELYDLRAGLLFCTNAVFRSAAAFGTQIVSNIFRKFNFSRSVAGS